MFTRFSVACFCGNVYVAPPCRCSVCGRTFSSESMNELRLRASRAWQTEEPALDGSRTRADELDVSAPVIAANNRQRAGSPTTSYERPEAPRETSD